MSKNKALVGTLRIERPPGDPSPERDAFYQRLADMARPPSKKVLAERRKAEDSQ